MSKRVQLDLECGMYLLATSIVGGHFPGYFKPGSLFFKFLHSKCPQKFKKEYGLIRIESVFNFLAEYILAKNLIFDPKSHVLKLNSDLKAVFGCSFILISDFKTEIFENFFFTDKENQALNNLPTDLRTPFITTNIGPELPLMRGYYQHCLSKGSHLKEWAKLPHSVPEILKEYLIRADLTEPTYTCIFMEEFFHKKYSSRVDNGSRLYTAILVLDGTVLEGFMGFSAILDEHFPLLFRISLARHWGVGEI